MNYIFLLAALILSTGCSSIPHERDGIQAHMGAKGIFSRPIELTKASPNPIASFQRCEESEIEEILWTHSEAEKDYYIVKLLQKGKYFNLEQINHQKLSSFKTEESPIFSLKSFFVEEMNIPSRMVKDQSLGRNVNARDLVCNGIVFTGMTSKELLFVKGRPTQLKIPSSERDGIEEWIYSFSENKVDHIAIELRNAKVFHWRKLYPSK